jgi:hypothetical protein
MLKVLGQDGTTTGFPLQGVVLQPLCWQKQQNPSSSSAGFKIRGTILAVQPGSCIRPLQTQQHDHELWFVLLL